LDEAQVEIVTVDYFRELGYEYIHGPQIAPDGDAPEREDYGRVVLTDRPRDTLLPKPLSGEILPDRQAGELPAVEAVAEEVA
jgi:hypothetical protein